MDHGDHLRSAPADAVGAAARPLADTTLLDRPLRIVNVGLERFAQDLEAAGVEVVHVDWAPPARGDARLAALLARLGS